jgi:glycosyltransferase, group 2 family
MVEISVLMSVYKSEKPAYFSRSLQSIWDDQILKPDEIILIEDGPLGEELVNIVDSWKLKLGEKLHLIINEQNLGLTKSLNKGLTLAKGKYIARMDSDDISIPERFKLQYEFMESHPEITVVGGCLQEFNDDNDCLGIRHYPISNEKVRKYIYKASPLAHPTVMIRREVFDAGIRYNEQYRTSQDLALWFDILISGRKIANLDNITIKFRRDNDVFKRRSKEKAKNEFKIYISGIRRLFGLFNLYYFFPLSRYLFRLMPISVIRFIYGSNLRTKLLQ